MSSVLLRLSNEGSPIDAGLVANGVLVLPAVAPKSTGDHPLFVLHFQLNAGSQLTREGTLYTNVPAKDVSFDRERFTAYSIENSFHKDITIEVPIYNPGPFAYYIEYTDVQKKKSDTFYFVVPPVLSIGNEYLPFNNINIESVISKCIGPLAEWDDFFNYIAAKGYNMIHFTPLQERGRSDSPYSIHDQLKFDPALFTSTKHATSFIHETLSKHNLLSLTDVVWNHTADNSDWIREYPDAGYNQETAPHLLAAIELDKALIDFSDKLEELNLPTEIDSHQTLDTIVEAIDAHVLEPLQLWQFYVVDRKAFLDAIKKHIGDAVSPINVPDLDSSNIEAVAQYVVEASGGVVFEGRFANKLDVRKVLAIAHSLGEDAQGFATRIVDTINAPLYAAYDDDVATIKTQLKDRIRFLRLDDNGPKLGKITRENRLTEAYFTRFTSNGTEWALANNGWIWGGNPLVDFASSASKAYLRREVIVWSDCVKLRYGLGYDDSPHLWDRMLEYTRLCAGTFDGFRIDNCHSTPLHVGEALLDEARRVNPNLYVVAELFSGSESMDKIFVERLGINSLIREAMQAWLVGELSRLVHKHGGRPIGSLVWLPLDDLAYPATKEPEKLGSYSQLPIPKLLVLQAPHALFMDCTHDNETPNQKRTVEDTLPNAALVAFCSSAIGSVFGYDEIYPHLLDVVGEHRQYTYDNGIGKVKAKLHDIRRSLAQESDDVGRDHEMYVHHDNQYITIQRYNARTGKGWYLIARSKFSEHEGEQVLAPQVLGGTTLKHEFSYLLEKNGKYEDDPKLIKGIPVAVVEIEPPHVEVQDNDTTVSVTSEFAPGSITVFSTQIPGVDASLDEFVTLGAVEASADLNLYDLNALLYRCEAEERDASGGADGPYSIPDFGTLVYAGLQGWITSLKKVILDNDLGSKACNHLRAGPWALDYVVNRLDKYSRELPLLAKFQDWLRQRIDAIRDVPYFLRPRYFALVVGVAYEAARFRALRLMDKHIQLSTHFVQSLAVTSVQLNGFMNNTSLYPQRKVSSMAAGLPHFSNDYMRCWGRDVFIAFRGLLIVPGRYEDARQHILGFAQTLKHGLIPNLLDAGRNPRYNARDAAWFFVQAIQEYVTHVPNGEDILQEKVKRRFPLDDKYVTWDSSEAFAYESSIEEIIYEILSRHAKGIKYREANAGPNLDSQMKDEGFNVEVHIDWSTGLVHGGSQFNCGTWMDKMGESDRAGNKGVPGTPRDGAAVELQGLLKSALRFVNGLHKQGKFAYAEVTKDDGSTISLVEWEDLLQKNFERCFYVPEDPAEDNNYEIDASLVNRRGIYKDLYKSGKPYEDYQLRGNFPIAMSVAPELFDKHHGATAINNADKILRGPVGLATLDPSDWNYRPYYLNSIDNDDFATSKGRNYHQGPEWVWIFGYFIRAFLHFNHVAYDEGKPSAEILTAINQRLQGHIKWINESPWSGLTELTNKAGALCEDLSPTQAWSTSCLLDLYYDLWRSLEYQ